MRKEKIFILLFAALILVLGGFMLWIALSPAKPPITKMELAIPDDRIPH